MIKLDHECLVFIFFFYIDLARAKSEALDNIYGSLKQNIKSCNAKRRRRRERWMTMKKKILLRCP